MPWIPVALLDDVPVMLIAFDNAKISPRPAKWDMRRVLMVSSMLALIGVVQSVALVRYLHHHEHFELEPLQTAMFMHLVIAGPMATIADPLRAPHMPTFPDPLPETAQKPIPRGPRTEEKEPRCARRG
jgi:H+-transporting ATPase